MHSLFCTDFGDFFEKIEYGYPAEAYEGCN